MDLRLVATNWRRANWSARSNSFPSRAKSWRKTAPARRRFWKWRCWKRAGYQKVKGKTAVDVKLTKFLPSLAEVPSKELEALKERAVKSGFDFIDFWAVDFDWHPNQPFHHDWQDYRTRKDRSLKTVSDAGMTNIQSPANTRLREGGGRVRLRHEHHGGRESVNPKQQILWIFKCG